MTEGKPRRAPAAGKPAEASFEDFVGVITRCSKQIQRIKAARASEWGLRGTDVMVLYYLERNPDGVTSSELARLVGVDRAAMSRTVARLTAAGLVLPDDERACAAAPVATTRSYRAPLGLSERGRAAARELDAAIDDVVASAARGFSTAERETMYATLDVILRNLTAIAESKERK